MQDPWLHEPDTIFSLPSALCSRNRESPLHATCFLSLYTPVSELSCPSKTCHPMASTEQWYLRRSTAPKTHTVKQAFHSLFTDCDWHRHSTGW
ncbi:hypothetical protein TNCV_9311 [Trichonephila clavipes]|nr:hypothetical protein TNCV_9311 [Trichonephila clavipes]